uniref:DUF6915 family protein n=1 Tax=Roseovarius sp. BRH_c41 TaxID=1629709 RepID=UPI000AAEA490|nr:hypothetical protein [Roseovarius sp. BRH_c41]
MAHPLHHAESSARKFGGVPDDYQFVHDWFDSSKEHLGLFVHRAHKHHTVGIYDAERHFGRSLIDNDPTQIVGDPRAAWVAAVAGHQTILGFEDWLLKVSVEHVQHRQNRAAA